MKTPRTAQGQDWYGRFSVQLCERLGYGRYAQDAAKPRRSTCAVGVELHVVTLVR